MAPTYWDPEWEELAKSMGPPPAIPDEDTQERDKWSAISWSSSPSYSAAPEDVVIKDFDVPDGPKVRVYRPTGGQDDAALPLILFAHGGGWFAGNLDTEDRSCRIVCSKVRAFVVAVDYRCNFDVPLAHMVDDLHAAFDWVRGRAAEHGADPEKIVLWGGSAGGSLVVALAYRLVQEGEGASWWDWYI